MRRRKAPPPPSTSSLVKHTPDAPTTTQATHADAGPSSPPLPPRRQHSRRTFFEWAEALLSVVLAYIGQAWYTYTGLGEGMVSLGRWMGGRGLEDAEERLELLRRGGGPGAGDGDGKTKRRRRRTSSVTPGGAAHFPGMVNLSGVLCYMNSVLQALASLPSLQLHLHHLLSLSIPLDLPTPVTNSLLTLLTALNTPSSSPPRPIRPSNLIAALQPLPPIRRLLSTREQQDAHELFLALSEAVSDEALKVAKEVLRLKGMAEVLNLQGYVAEKLGKGGLADGAGRKMDKERARRVRGLMMPWEGLIARRRVCRTCGWAEAVRMDTLGGMELALPQHGDVSLESCVGQYLSPELLTGVTCEMCSLRQTIEFYKLETARLALPPSSAQHLNGDTLLQHTRSASGSFGALENLPQQSTSTASTQMSDKRKRRLKEARRAQSRLQEMLDSSTVLAFGESSVPPLLGSTSSAPIPVKWQKANTDSVRETIIARPPQSLRLHFIRSSYTPYGIQVKSSARVAFPMILDLTGFVDRGVWEERHVGQEGVMAMLAGPNGNGDKVVKERRKVIYRLEAAILHYGYTTSSGHFIAIRRKPVPDDGRGDGDDDDDGPWQPERISKTCPVGCRCQDCVYFGQVREPGGGTAIPGRGWLRVSDDEVDEVGEEALREGAGAVFMLFYERVGEYEVKSRVVAANGGGPE